MQSLNPSVPLSAIRALVQQWREEAGSQIDDWNHEYALALDKCADQLAALCPALPEDQP
jgi:hypothetical protein